MVLSQALLGAIASSGVGVAYAGYFAGGNAGITTVDRFLFADDSRTTLGTGLTNQVRGTAGMSNAGVAGYFAGGDKSGAPDVFYTTVDKFAFANDARSTLSTGLSAATTVLTGMSNSGTAGYTAGGYDGDAAAFTTTVDKFAFADDGRTTLGTGLSAATGYLTGMSNSGTAGYTCGGSTASGRVTTVDKFAFADDARSTLGTGLSTATAQFAGMSNSGTAGYTVGGRTDADVQVDTVDKFAFADDGRTTLGTGLSAATRILGAMANSGTAGYVGGGTTASGVVATVDKFAFSDDGRTTLGTGLSGARNSCTGMENSEALV